MRSESHLRRNYDDQTWGMIYSCLTLLTEMSLSAFGKKNFQSFTSSITRGVLYEYSSLVSVLSKDKKTDWKHCIPHIACYLQGRVSAGVPSAQYGHSKRADTVPDFLNNSNVFLSPEFITNICFIPVLIATPVSFIGKNNLHFVPHSISAPQHTWGIGSQN